ncbi:hypothetical protein [Pseudobacteroides cellulosolvens]|uniref:Uncharacterized protein n=1 Tax=Pseudobacteroides cellulosolvens ATCC 35603 = DSM 2933 TaxID=398512 RepID=A0A0L6JX34_9FIRM|nr:hypothetical protein [Pseudobacteroides cellulosolvens]KNY30289.1 hypothetical protein Bccel_5569 [Pseudobacteroides cellulosolvens ATCC 35603 = DSM 2933]
MNFPGSMMESMFEGMSTEDKKNMMSSMMDSFFASMSQEEKRQLMSEMMSRMMGNFSSTSGDTSTNQGSSNWSMMDMMNMMMGGGSSSNQKSNQRNGNWSMMDMMNMMMGMPRNSSSHSDNADNDLKNLFTDWLNQVESEILTYINETQDLNPDQIALKLKISRSSAMYFIEKLSKEKKINLNKDET